MTERLLCDGLQMSAERLPDKCVLVSEEGRYTYGELLEAAGRLAGAFRERGLGRGDRVAIYADNGWPAVVSVFATLLAGGVFLLVNPQTKTAKLRYVLEDSGARFLVVGRRVAKGASQAIRGNRCLAAVIVGTDAPLGLEAPHPPVERFEHLVKGSTPFVGPSGAIPLDLAALIYTSGSTGDPKGVMMTHQSMVFTVGSLVEYLRLSEEDRILNVLPLAFDYGLYQLLMVVRLGATLVLERSFSYPAQVFGRVREEQVTVFPGVPTIFSTLVSAHRRKEVRFPSVRRVTNTAAALPPGHLPLLQQVFPNALIYKMYGLTECKRVCYLEPEMLAKRPRSVGKAIPGTEVFLLDADGKPVPAGKVGILHVRGTHVMRGYWKKPEQTAEMLRPGPVPGEQVLCTQDRFRMDSEGYLYFVGRSDDIIKSRGEKVSPVEVENALYAIPGVREAAVVGVPDDLLGEAVHAYVVLDDGVALSEGDVRKGCLARLESTLVPVRVWFLPELPKTASGKITKKALRPPPETAKRDEKQ